MQPEKWRKLLWEETIRDAASLGRFAPTGFVSSTSGKIAV